MIFGIVFVPTLKKLNINIMKKYFLFILLATLPLLSFAQNQEVDPEHARALLQELDAKHESYKAMKVDFSLIVDNRQKNKKTTEEGHLDVMGDKFHLSIMRTETFYTGKAVYTYSQDNNEVTISSVDEEEQTSMSPLQLLASWKEGFNLRYLGDAEIDGVQSTEIDLYPVERNTAIVRIRVTIDQKTHALRKILQQTKDGMLMTYVINKLTPLESLPNDTFLFNKNNYPGVEIVDMR